MSNMSYCRFENTSHDLADCARALAEMDAHDKTDKLADLGAHERAGMERLIALCVSIAETHRDKIDDDELDRQLEALETEFEE